MLKYCGKCKQEKDISDFYRNKCKPDGYANQCSICAKKSNAKWREENPNYARQWYKDNKEWQKEYYQDNREYEIAYQRQYRIDNPEYSREWRRANKDKVNLYNNSRRMKFVDQWVENVEISIIYDRDFGTCQLCGEYCDLEEFSLDHIIPISNGGEHSYANAQTAHRSCNSKKQNRIGWVSYLNEEKYSNFSNYTLKESADLDEFRL